MAGVRKPLTRRLSNHNFLAKDSLQPSVQAKVKQLLQFIVYGNQAEAEKMLVNNPQILRTLLTQKAEVIDYSGRKILGTALQIAMGAKDVRYHDDEERMVEMLEKYYRKLPDGEAVMAAQIAGQFPEGFEKQEEERRKRDSEALDKVLHAITTYSLYAAFDDAIEDFIDYLKSQTANTITSGYHSNDQLLHEALKIYDQIYECFGRCFNYYWRKVIDNIERYLTACEAQAFCQGINNIVDGEEKLTRSLTFRYDANVRFYPLDTDPRFRLGEAGPSVLLHCEAGSWKVLSDKKHQRCEHLRSIDANLLRVRAP